jgi:hypothetical protein
VAEQTYSHDMDGVYYALEDLAHIGDGSVNAIARHLHALGIRGERKSSYCCPIANWLRLNFGDDCDPEVDSGEIRVRKFKSPEGDWIDPPDEISDFITFFDRGSFSDLAAVPRG